MFPGLLGAGRSRRSREIFVGPEHVIIRKMGELVKPVPRDKRGRSSQLGRAWRQMGPLPFLDSLPCLVRWDRRFRAQGPI